MLFLELGALPGGEGAACPGPRRPFIWERLFLKSTQGHFRPRRGTSWEVGAEQGQCALVAVTGGVLVCTCVLS